MGLEASGRSPHTVQALKEGDFVAVHLNTADLKAGFFGSVTTAGTDRLRIVVHQPVTDEFSEDSCLGWDVVIPWPSILFVRHLRGLLHE